MTAELLTIRAGMEWSHIVLDEETGLFTAHGSYGTFAYTWPPQYRSTPLRAFVSSLDFDYFIGKTRGSGAVEFDEAGSRQAIKRLIIDARRTHGETKSGAREAWNELSDIPEGEGEDFFARQIADNDTILNVIGHDDWWHVLARRYKPECTEFWKVIWPAFLAEIKPAAPSA